MTARLRLILPTNERLVLIGFFFLVIQGLRLYVEWLRGAPLLPGEPLLHAGDEYLRLIAVLYGMSRVVSLHPFYRPGYRAWLERTPWTSARPLPLGPVALAWEDFVPTLVFVLLAFSVPGADPVRIVALGLFSYLAALAFTMAPTGEPAYAYLLAFGLGLLLRLYPRPEMMLAAGSVVYAIGYIGLRRSLARFPWNLSWQGGFSPNAPLERYIQGAPPESSGWPYDRLCPNNDPPSRIATIDALLLSMLAGWWLFAGEVLFTDRRAAVGMYGGVLLVGTFLLSFFRLVVYTQGYAPPISLWGRIWTLRWIVPGYDQVFVGPICTVLICPLSILSFYRLGWNPMMALPTASALVLFTALAAPPRLRRWRLTGHHRVVAALGNQKEFIKVG